MDPITPFNPNNYYGVTLPKPKSELNMETFLRLLTVQLSHQNPLEPMNDRDFFAQLAQLGQVQGMSQMQEAVNATQANSLLGKRVSALYTEAGSGLTDLVTGTATRLIANNGKYEVVIRTDNGFELTVPTSSIQTVELTNP